MYASKSFTVKQVISCIETCSKNLLTKILQVKLELGRSTMASSEKTRMLMKLRMLFETLSLKSDNEVIMRDEDDDQE